MAFAMAPPVLPGFSLRVQLFSPNAYAAGDKPVRCFRVVTSPEVTIREFCQEASRIHEINYGEPIAIKKCQDDQEFDVTQSEIVGHLFASAATIRVIQASTTLGVRDSVPPNSALRYDPELNTNRKRERGGEGRARPNGTPAAPWTPNKRQRISDLDPDKPIPSRERDWEAIQEDRGSATATTIPDSQQSTQNGNPRHVRTEIPKTPSPSPQPTLPHPTHNGKRSTDQPHRKSAILDAHINPSPILFQTSPPRQEEAAPGSGRSKSASYHIQRATERGTSVSTAATSPLSADQQLPALNRSVSINKRKSSEPTTIAKTNKLKSRSPNEDSVYEVDNIESDGESAAAILNKTRASLRVRHSPQNGTPGKFNTPPSGTSRNSRGRESASASASTLPLTPNSKQREEKQIQKQQADGAKNPRKAAHEAAELRLREASERKKREAEEARQAEQAKKRKLEQEKEAEERLAAVNATAARLEKERLEQRERDRKAEEERQADEKRQEELKLKKANERAEKLEQAKQARLEKEKQEAERIALEKAEADVERLRKEEDEKKRAKEVVAAEKLRKSEERKTIEAERLRKQKEEADAAEKPRKSKENDQAEALKRKSSPIVPESASGTLARNGYTTKSQSSTPLIPTGRKSALKSSQPIRSSSPALPRSSPSDIPKGSSQAQPSHESTRRVSFDLNGTTIMPSKATATTPKRSKLQAVPPEKQSRTPILPPSAGRFSKVRNGTPLKQTTILPAQTTTPKTPITNTTPRVTIKSASPIPVPLKKGEGSSSTTPKGGSKFLEAPPVPIASISVSSDGSDSEDDIPAKASPTKASNTTPQHVTSTSGLAAGSILDAEEPDEEQQQEDMEMASGQSSPRESRSPVIFSQHPLKLAPTLELPKAVDDAETQSISEASSDEEDSVESPEERDEDDQREEEMEWQATSTVQVPQSSLDLPRAKPDSQSSFAGKQKQRKIQLSPSPSDKDSNTQDDIDYQLTSSMYEVLASNSSPASQKPVKSTPLPATPSSQRPAFKIGASLQSLNASKNLATSSQPQPSGATQRNWKAKSKDESQSESGDDTETSSDSESEDEEPASLAFKAQLSQARSVPLPDSDSDSSSNSSSDDDSEEETVRNVKKGPAADIARKIDSQSSNSQGSQKKQASKSRIAGRDIVKAQKKKREKKYLSGYTFSQIS